MKHATIHKRSHLRQGIELAVVGVLVCAIIFLALLQRAGRVSPEVGFTDTTPSGLKILPASGSSCANVCVSYNNRSGQCMSYQNTCGSCTVQVPYGKDQNGNYMSNAYDLFSNASNENIQAYTLHFCVNNTSGYQYFVPANSQTELQDFYSAGAAGLPGVNVQNLQ